MAASDDLDLPSVSDAVLVVSISRYRQEALAEAYRRHAGAVFALSRRLLVDATLAEEIVQEVFLRLWNNPEKFDPERGSLRSYLLAQCHGRSVDLLRSETSRRLREERDVRRTAEAGYDLEHEVVDLSMGAAAAVVIGALGVKVVQQGDQLDRINAALEDDAMLTAANLALVDPSADVTKLTSADGTLSASAVVLPDGVGYLMLQGLPALDDTRTYQLWGQTSGGLISLGLLGADPGEVVPFRVGGAVAALAITEEVAGGVTQSKNAPALLGRFD